MPGLHCAGQSGSTEVKKCGEKTRRTSTKIYAKNVTIESV